MYVINFVRESSDMGNPVGLVKSVGCLGRLYFYVCIFKVLCMCQQVRAVMNFCGYCGLDNLNRGRREGEMLHKATIWPVLCIVNV